MTFPTDISVRGENAATGNLRPVISEIHQALTSMVENGTHGMIDLHNLPFSAQDFADLEHFLGVGEVALTLSVLGKTKIQECGFPGVWRIEHFDDQDQRMGYFIEIGHVPEILRSQCDDIKQGLDTMTALLRSGEHT